MYHLYMDSIDISNIYLQSKNYKTAFLSPFFSFVLGGIIFILPSVCKAHFFCFYTIMKSVRVI